MLPKVSIVTVVFNNQSFIECAINSVLSQTYQNIEYIVIDGGSVDGTIERIKKYSDKIAHFVSEKDRGIYDAMNKGIRLATGDIVGILNSDDFYASNTTVETVVRMMDEKQVDACYGDLVYVDRQNVSKMKRCWKSCEYKDGLFRKGWMPPHPTFFVKRWAYEKYGLFNLDLPAGSDFELLFRFLDRHQIKSCYIPQVFIKMRLGGFSNKNICNIFRQNMTIMRILRENQIHVSPFFLCSKFVEKFGQFLNKI